MRKETLGDDEMQFVLSPSHPHIQQTALLLEFQCLVPVPRSDGIQPSTALSTNTDFHSCPSAEWIVERTK